MVVEAPSIPDVWKQQLERMKAKQGNQDEADQEDTEDYMAILNNPELAKPEPEQEEVIILSFSYWYIDFF
jgi:hypothetical protein